MKVQPTEFKIIRSEHKLHFQFYESNGGTTQNAVYAKNLIRDWLSENIDGDFEEGNWGIIPEIVLDGDQMDEFDTKEETFWYWIENDYKNCMNNPKVARQTIRELKEKKNFKRMFELADDPFEQARFICDECKLHYDENCLWWKWNSEKVCYEMTNEVDILNLIAENINEATLVKSNKRANLLKILEMVARKRKPKEFQRTWVQLKDKIIDYDTGKIINATPEYFNTNPIPFPYTDKNQRTPEIDKLLEEWVGKEYIKTVKQTIAISMVQDYPLHRIITLTGSGCNGKGVFLRFLKTVLGDINVSSTELDKLINSNFEMTKLYRKLACIMGETNFNVLEQTGRLKSLSGQDLVGIEFKGKTGFDFVNYATIFIATNSLPMSTDKTDGFYRRWLILDFPNKFTEGTNPLDRIPVEEYSGLVSQCVNLIKLLLSTGRFDKDGSIEERKQRYEEKSNPLGKFIKEYFIKDVNSELPFFWFYDKYISFCEQRGIRVVRKSEVSSLLRLEGYELREMKPKKDWVLELGIVLPENCDTKWLTIIGLRGGERWSKVVVSKSVLTSHRDQLEEWHPRPPQTTSNLHLKIYQYIKEDTSREYFVDDLADFVSTTDEAQKIFNSFVEKGDLMITANNGYKVVLK